MYVTLESYQRNNVSGCRPTDPQALLRKFSSNKKVRRIGAAIEEAGAGLKEGYSHCVVQQSVVGHEVKRSREKALRRKG